MERLTTARLIKGSFAVVTGAFALAAVTMLGDAFVLAVTEGSMLTHEIPDYTRTGENSLNAGVQAERRIATAVAMFASGVLTGIATLELQEHIDHAPNQYQEASGTPALAADRHYAPSTEL